MSKTFLILFALCISTLVVVNTTSLFTSNETIKMGNSADYGNYLTDSNGVTLYMFEIDYAGTTSACYGSCATAWPPLLIASGKTPVASVGVTQSLLGTITRTDGGIQVTYNKWPLYYYKGEINIGGVASVNVVGCQGVNGSGGYWFIMNPEGKVSFFAKGRPANLASGNNLEVAASLSTILGDYIADKDKVVLYTFEKDQFLKSNCYTDCATAWPPLIYAGTTFPTIGTGVNKDLIFLTSRTDGTKQITYNGWPLYYYKDEKTAGTQNCQNKNMNGGYWWIISPNGDVNKKDPTLTTAASFLGLSAAIAVMAFLF